MYFQLMRNKIMCTFKKKKKRRRLERQRRDFIEKKKKKNSPSCLYASGSPCAPISSPRSPVCKESNSDECLNKKKIKI